MSIVRELFEHDDGLLSRRGFVEDVIIQPNNCIGRNQKKVFGQVFIIESQTFASSKHQSDIFPVHIERVVFWSFFCKDQEGKVKPRKQLLPSG